MRWRGPIMASSFVSLPLATRDKCPATAVVYYACRQARRKTESYDRQRRWRRRRRPPCQWNGKRCYIYIVRRGSDFRAHIMVLPMYASAYTTTAWATGACMEYEKYAFFAVPVVCRCRKYIVCHFYELRVGGDWRSSMAMCPQSMSWSSRVSHIHAFARRFVDCVHLCIVKFVWTDERGNSYGIMCLAWLNQRKKERDERMCRWIWPR